VAFAADCIGPVAAEAVAKLKDGERCCSWKTRAFTRAKKTTIPNSSGALAALGDIYVNDAFSAAHRAHASTEGLAHLLHRPPGVRCRRSFRIWARRSNILSTR